MKLGILVNSDTFLNAIIGITASAVSRGHEVDIFAMDEGVKLLQVRSFVELIELNNVTMAYCKYNLEKLGVSTEIVPDAIVAGSQYDNAVMVHNADKVIVL